ncbi:RHS repeat-associated core domain-containing protein, partial [Mucilaginibacter panaciglaebae]|uniref:RHS repeat-associated core domain-containing protein n=1 Tax=Mucilaginibacter panaciglaebae TaxID=502331 RepID=UPI0031E556D3
NNRVNFRVEHNGTVNLSQVQNYYPFGETMGDSTMNYTTTPVDLYQYSGKELQPELSLNTYDFGARNYNPVLARWLTMDPLSVTYEDETPYGYVGNNPLNMIDPDGMQYNGNGISPGQLASSDLTIHSGSGGSAAAGSAATGSGGSWGSWGWVGAGASAVGQGISAFNATNLRTTTATDFNASKNVQGNVISPNSPPSQVISNKSTFANNIEGRLNMTNNWLTYAGYGEAALKATQIGMLKYRQTLSITEKVGTFSRFSGTYRVVGVTGKVLGGAATYVGAPLNTYLDYRSMQSGKIGAGRFSYRTAVTATGIGVASYFGPIPGAIVGGLGWAGEKSYNGFMLWLNATSKYLSDFNRGLSNGWYPGR